MRRRLATIAATVGAIVFAAGCHSRGPMPRSLAEWEQFDFAKREVGLGDLKGLSGTDLARVRGIIFGKHGRVFEDSALQAWLMPRPWYVADGQYTPERLNDRERANIEVVREAEARARPHIAPGDLLFFKDRPITSAMLGQHTQDEWDILELEIPVIHGYRVDLTEGYDGYTDESDTATVWRWYQERYWYHPTDDYPYQHPERVLSAVERANIDTIRVARLLQYAARIEPGSLDLLAGREITPKMISANKLYELRVLRNEIYARHGYRFSTKWLQEHFADKPWYTPRDDFKEIEITELERRNLATIRAREDELHAQLSTEPFTQWDVNGLTGDDARILRNEIFARHGYAFRDPKLAAYFAALSWYHPDPSFTDASLSEIEKGNVKVLRDQEIHAKSGQRFLPEG
ncbi:MAG TPA: YARHG domain-containing protein [Gemmatimonadaceae bacterium]|nr:YARHG domain-containing protein [Gemmatimonadaceae bacterium]